MVLSANRVHFVSLAWSRDHADVVGQRPIVELLGPVATVAVSDQKFHLGVVLDPIFKHPVNRLCGVWSVDGRRSGFLEAGD